MKFKIPPHSGFAVLLRSPWWVSFLLAGAIALACLVLLPADLAAFGAAGVLPIVVIGCIAAWRQARAPSAARVQAARAAATAMPWRDFAALLTRAWQAEGHQVQALEGQPPGADLCIRRGAGSTGTAGTSLLVAARRYKAAHHGVEPLRALQQALASGQAQAGAYVVLQGSVSEAAREFASQHGIALLEGAALDALLLKG
ncbi:restriction endonuclease [Melaminivora sp.]